MHKKAKWLISTLLTLITPAALKSQSPEGQNPHGISIESLCSKPNQQQIEMLTRYAEERGLVFHCCIFNFRRTPVNYYFS